MDDHHRSAATLACWGFFCLSAVPVLAGPDAPLHWVTSGALLLVGLRLAVGGHRTNSRAARVGPSSPLRDSGKALAIVTLAILAAVIVILFRRAVEGLSVSAISLVLPAVTLALLAAISLVVSRRGGWERPEARPSRPTPGPLSGGKEHEA